MVLAERPGSMPGARSRVALVVFAGKTDDSPGDEGYGTLKFGGRHYERE